MPQAETIASPQVHVRGDRAQPAGQIAGGRGAAWLAEPDHERGTRPVRPEILIPNGPGSRCRRPRTADRGPPGGFSPRYWRTPATPAARCRTGFDLAYPGRHHPRAQAGAAVEPARRLGHLRASRPCAAGQRGRLHRRPGHGRRVAQPGRRYAGTC